MKPLHTTVARRSPHLHRGTSATGDLEDDHASESLKPLTVKSAIDTSRGEFNQETASKGKDCVRPSCAIELSAEEIHIPAHVKGARNS